MAKVPYQTISETDMARGIDARSTENRIPSGYAEDLLNADTNSNGHLSKRPGYQGYYGYLPLRVSSIEHSGTDIRLTVDSSIDTSSLVGSPLVVYGLLSSAQSGDWTNTANAEYYTTFSTNARKLLSTGTNTLTIEEADHGVDSADMLADIVISDSASDNDNTYFVPDDVKISKSDPYDVDFDYTNSGPATDSFVFFEDMTATAGSIYIDTTNIPTGSTTVTLTAATHGLSNFKIMTEHYYDNGSEWEKVIPDSVTVNATDGEVNVTYTNSGSAADYKTILRTAAIANTTSQVIAAATTDTIIVSTTEAFNFWTVLVNVSGELTKIYPDDVVYDDSADTLTFTITNSGSQATYHVYYDPAVTASSTITVTDNGNVSASYTDDNPQLTMWGIPHDNIYKTSTLQEGHVSHIDVYKSDVEERVVAGLGGVIHSAQTRTESGATYLMPTTNISIENRIGADVFMAPLFTSSARANPRTRGEVVDASITSDNLATVTAVSYVSEGVADYTITLTGNTGDTFAASTDDGFDYITISSMGHGLWNGTFLISSIQSESTTEIVVRVANSAATAVLGSSNDEIGANGRAGVFTDKITLSATTTFAVDDIVTSEIFSALTPSVTSTTGTTMYVDGITTSVSGPLGTVLAGRRTSAILPVEATTNFVVGDMCTLTGMDHQVRVTSIDVSNSTLTIDESITIDDSSTTPDAISVVGRWIPIEAPTPTDDLPDTTRFSYFDSSSYEQQDTIRSTMVADNLYMTNYNDEVMKFDGTNIYQAGLFRWQPQLFVQLDTTTTSISTSGATANEAAAAVGAVFKIATGEEVQFREGDRIIHDEDSATYTVKSVDNDGTNGLVEVNGEISGTAGTGDITRQDRYRYYFRLNAVDANRNIIASAATGSSDFYFDLSAAGQIHIRAVGLPAWGNLDYDRLDLEVYRTAANGTAPFYRVRVVDVDFNHGGGYIDIVDATTDESLRDLDPVNTALEGAELGTGWEQPLRAKYMTSTGNRLVLGNVKDYPEWDISLLPSGDATAITAANLDNSKWLFRKDSTDTGTTTDMVARATYEFTDGSTTAAVTITPASHITNNSGTSFTIDKVAHGLAVGDWVYLFHAAAGTENHLKYAGWWQIASKNDDDFTIDFTHDSSYSPSSADVDTYCVAETSTDIPVWIGTDGNMNQVGANTIDEFTAMIRLANAINASMRMTDTSNSSFSSFVPWLTANAGSEYGAGRLVVRQPGVFTTTAEVVLPAAITDAQIFVNQTLRAAAAEISATTKVYPSRVLVSYPNFPELFNDPNNEDSQQVIDVNSSDGQQITGMIPFFGSSTFGAGLVESTLVVFKTNSVYLLDVSTGSLSRLQSRGLGCTAPYSIAQTQDGIMFANESGIFKLDRNQQIVPAGENLERIWEDTVNTDQVAKMTGHHFGVGQKYKLSVPSGDATTNSLVMVYDHKREGRDQEYGAWTKYDNHPSTGWCNLGDMSFFASTSGDVFSIRNLGDSTDYRDDASAISMTVLYRALDFGAAGQRKVINHVTSHFQLRKSDMDGTTLSVSTDLDGSFTSAGTFTLTNSSGVKGRSAQSSLPKRRFEYLQLKYVNSTKDEDVVLAGVSFEVGGLTTDGIPQQAESN